MLFRLRGMPYSATVDDIVSFLGELSLHIIPHGIHFVLNQQVGKQIGMTLTKTIHKMIMLNKINKKFLQNKKIQSIWE